MTERERNLYINREWVSEREREREREIGCVSEWERATEKARERYWEKEIEHVCVRERERERERERCYRSLSSWENVRVQIKKH